MSKLLQKVALTIWLFGAVACVGDDESGAVTLKGITMGTTYSVTIVSPPQRSDLKILRENVAAELERIDSIASTYRANSQLSLFNQSPANRWIPISDEFCAMLEATWQLRAVTNGAFDITIGTLVDLWGFGKEATGDQLPTQMDIDKARDQIAAANIQLDCALPAGMKTTTPMHVDMSGWAKGYAVDKVAAFLDNASVDNYLIEIGGEIRVQGRNVRGEPYAIGIEHPRSVGDVIDDTLRVTDTGVATSGDYRNFREIDGVRYSHTIDPRTGWPVDHDLASVTVIHPSVASADAYATALLVMGPVQGPLYANENEIAALFVSVDEDGVKTEQSDSFRSAVAQPRVE